MTDEFKVIGLNRKPFVPPAPAVEPEPVKVLICQASVNLLERTLERVKAGELRCMCIAGLASGGPMASMPVHGEVSFMDLALLNIAADALHEQVKEHIYGTSSHYGVTADGEEYDLDDEDEDDDMDPAS